MQRKAPRRAAQILAVIAVACAMLAGLGYILQRHAQQADSYPPFSAFRTLPEGTSVFYESLRRASGMTAVRNVQPLGTVHYNDAAILMLDIEPVSLSANDQWFSDMEDLADKGNRVIIGLRPHHYRFVQPGEDRQDDALKPWKVRLAFVRESDVRDEEEGELTSGWPMYFAQSAGWNITRKEDGRAVVIERAQGKGVIVLMANPYPFSNAAMVDDRQTAFLADLIGPVHETIFDETHFGLEETGSIAALARRYRLQGLVLALLVTAALFIWKSAAGFPPVLRGGVQDAESVIGEDSNAAFLNLLRRNIKPDDILSTCVEQWRKMYQRKAGSGVADAIDLAESGRKTPVQTYAQIQQVLAQPRPINFEPRRIPAEPRPLGSGHSTPGANPS